MVESGDKALGLARYHGRFRLTKRLDRDHKALGRLDFRQTFLLASLCSAARAAPAVVTLAVLA